MQTFQIQFPEHYLKKIESIEKSILDLKQDVKVKNLPKYYTRREVSEIFQVNISTIAKWQKNGTIEYVCISSRVYITQEAIDKAIIKFNS